MKFSKYDTKTLIMARYGMLWCAKNFKTQFGGQNCQTCGTIDDENHRINECVLYKEKNWHGKEEKVDFNILQ